MQGSLYIRPPYNFFLKKSMTQDFYLVRPGTELGLYWNNVINVCLLVLFSGKQFRNKYVHLMRKSYIQVYLPASEKNQTIASRQSPKIAKSFEFFLCYVTFFLVQN